jgi:hypothetical protein
MIRRPVCVSKRSSSKKLLLYSRYLFCGVQAASRSRSTEESDYPLPLSASTASPPEIAWAVDTQSIMQRSIVETQYVYFQINSGKRWSRKSHHCSDDYPGILLADYAEIRQRQRPDSFDNMLISRNDLIVKPPL